MDTIKERYFELLTSGANLQKLCDLTAEYAGNPIALTLVTRTIIAKSQNYTNELVTEYTSGQELASQKELQELEHQISKLLCSHKPIVKIWPYLKHKRVNCGCFYNNIMLAVIDCPITDKNKIEDAIAAIELAAPVFVTMLRLHSYITTKTTDPMQTYLVGLLKGDIQDQYQQKYLYNSFIDTINAWKLIWICPKKKAYYKNVENIINIFCAKRRNFEYACYEDGFVILLDAEQSKSIDELYKICSEYYNMSISETFIELKELMNHLKLAQSALHLALFEELDSEIIFVKKYKIPLLFLSACQNYTIDTSDIPVICEIKKYDAEHDSDYYITLRAYLLHNQDCNCIARILHVHKNTVVYRLQRISELFKIDLKDCRVITELYLSLFLKLL